MIFNPTRMIAIAAMGQKRKIGLANRLPWRNKKELAHFSDTTQDSILIMGRKTWDSIPKQFWKPRGRKVIVISKTQKGGNKDVFYVDSPEQAVMLMCFVRKTLQKVFICGGESIYKFFLPHINELMISEMEYDGAADSYFPPFEDQFECVEMKLHKSEQGNFKVKTYLRRSHDV